MVYELTHFYRGNIPPKGNPLDDLIKLDGMLRMYRALASDTVYIYLITWLAFRLLDIAIDPLTLTLLSVALETVIIVASTWMGLTNTANLRISLGAASTIMIIYSKRLHASIRTKALLESQQERLDIRENAIEAMREQRHEILNDLAVVSAYMQMGMPSKARQAVDFLAAKLADKYNYSELPKDAWLSMIGRKQRRAAQLGIELAIHLEAETPTDFNEQRLLPKVAALLLDNAFDAVNRDAEPRIELVWRHVGQNRLLSVENNGPIIPSDRLDRLFEYGYSSKSGPDRGWGLTICKRIAAELGGKLSVRTSAKSTKFILLLIRKELQGLAEAAATREEN